MTTAILHAGRKAAGSVVTFLESLPKDKAWRVVVEEFKPRRSLSQNAYLHVCYKTFGDALGYDPEDMREALLGTYFGWKEKKVPRTPSNREGVESVPVRTTTTDETGKRDVLSKKALSEYVAFIQRKAAEQGIFIPDPEGDL